MLDRTAAAGYEQYEISNFCLPGYESRHNSKYWTCDPVYGFGCSAHSYDGQSRRWANERDTSRYVDLVEQGQSPVVDTTELAQTDIRSEAVFLGLRLLRGVDLKEYRERFGRDLSEDYSDELDRLADAGLIEFPGHLMRLTRRGALLSNEVFSAFV
jgi:oxygen-independent coproporphyrinogen-3 oxidase